MYCPHCMHVIQNDKQSNTCPICGGNLNVQNLSSQLPVGTILENRFYLGKVIGQGGFGITYVGCDMKLNMKIAVKEYYPQGLVNRDTNYNHELTITAGDLQDVFEREKHRFISEARILAEFADNPNVVRVSDILTANNTIYIVMEYIDGITLETFCRENGKLAFNAAVSMLDPIMEALDEIHEKGLIHRDITPTNIMITNRRKVVKLLDFGAAADYGTGSETSMTVLLKKGYAPLEQYISRGRRGPWSDVYGLCATIYSLITGEVPVESVERMVKDTLKYPSELGAAITLEQEAVLMCGLAVQVEQRFSSMKDLQNGFHSAEKGIVPECAKPFVRNRNVIDGVQSTMSSANDLAQARNYQETEVLPKEADGGTDRRETLPSQETTNKNREGSGSRKWTETSGKAVFLIAIIVFGVLFLKFMIDTSGSSAPAPAPAAPAPEPEAVSAPEPATADADYYYSLGEDYYYGRGVAQDYEEAVKYYRLAADQGLAEAQYSLGYMYQYERGVAQDYEEAVKYYRLAAEQGNADAQNNLGVMYRNGYGVDQDYEEAVKYYRLAAEQGNAYAQNNLGWMYENGYGVAQDYEEAVKYYRLAAEQGNAIAQRNLGVMYQNGYGVDQDYEEAVKYYRLAAEQGNASAQNDLGVMYYYGYGVKQDYEEAVKYYRLAAEQGNADAQTNLGDMYYYGYGVKQDYEEAVKYYRLAADQGHVAAQNMLGDMYHYGHGVDRYYKEAVKYYRLAADQGNAVAQSNLGYMYNYGYGVEQDYEEAVKYYRLAADQGNAYAQNNLGVMYEYGRGVDQDYEEAKKYYQLAADQGDADAQKRLESPILK